MRQGEIKIESQLLDMAYCASKTCHHAFTLKPIKTGLYYTEETKVLCCP